MTHPVPFKIRPYQKTDIKRMRKEKTRGALNASVTGAGKTLVGVEVIRQTMIQQGDEFATQVLIIAPLNTYDGWTKTVYAQTGVRLTFVGAPSTTPPHLFPELGMHALKRGNPGWYFIGWDYFQQQMQRRLMESPFIHVNHVIYDEIHRAAGRAQLTKRKRLPDGTMSEPHLTVSGASHKLAKAVAQRDGYRLAFSATPFGSTPEGAWSVGHILWPTDQHRNLFGSFWRWANRNLEQEEVRVAQGRAPVIALGKELNPGSIVREFPCYIRHEAHTRCCKYHPKGIKDDLPPRVIHRVPVQLSKGQRKLYDQLEANMLAWVKDHDWPIDSKGLPMVNSLRMHQVCLATPTTELIELLKKDAPPEQIIKVRYPLDAKSTKIDAMLEILDDHQDEPFLVLTHATGLIPAIIDRIRKRFKKLNTFPGIEAVEGWDGTVSMKARAGIKDQFLKRKTQIIVANIEAIGTGTDGFQTVCSNEIWVSLDNRMVNNVQGAGRLNRDGQQNPVNVWEIYADDTIELDQFIRLDERARIMDATLNPVHLQKKGKRK